MPDRCYDTYPHPAHTTPGIQDCPGVPVPRPVPTTADRMHHATSPAYDAGDAAPASAYPTTPASAASQSIADLRAELADVLHDLQIAVGPTYTTAPSAAIEAARRIGLAERERDHALAERDRYTRTAANLLHQRDEAAAELERVTAERDRLVDTIGRLVSLPPEQIAEMHKVGYSAAASVPSRRMQGEPPRLTSDQVGLRSVQAHVDQLQAERHHAQGYAEAVAALCDDDRYTDWWESNGGNPDERARYHLARYLEAVGPDGPDVTAPKLATGGTIHPGYHVTRGCGPSDLEADCPCPKEACGAVDTRRAVADCDQHPADRARTMRQMHRADQCPGPRR